MIDETELMRAVVTEYLSQSVGIIAGSRLTANQRSQMIEAARGFLCNPSEELDTVCALARLNPDSMRERAIAFLKDAPTFELTVLQDTKP